MEKATIVDLTMLLPNGCLWLQWTLQMILIECHQHSYSGNLVFGRGPIHLGRETLVLHYGFTRDLHVQGILIEYLDTI